MSIRVKPLQWDEHGRAGVYRVNKTYGQGPRAYFLAYGNRIIGHFDDDEQAKVAANDHHREHVLVSIEADPA